MPAAAARYLYRFNSPCCGRDARTSLPQLPSHANAETIRFWCPFCRLGYTGTVFEWLDLDVPRVDWRLTEA